MSNFIPAVEYTDLTPPSKLFVKMMQNVSQLVVPRGLPRIGWIGRRFFLGKGFKKINYRNRFHICCNTDSYHNVMFGYGIENRHVDRLLANLLKPGAVFFDIGANIGMISLQVSSIPTIIGQIEVHCFEPDPSAFAWLKTNYELNAFKMILNQCAVGAKHGHAELTVSTVSGWSTMAPEPEEGFSFLTKAAKTTVEIVPIDDYCREKNVQPTLIKIDVEGFETEVLRGGEKIFTTAKPTLLIEVNPMRLKAANSSDKEMFGLLQNYGYHAFHIDSSKLLDSAGRSQYQGMLEAKAGDVQEGEISDILVVPDTGLRSHDRS